jgi:U4/U6.U5 tri-snRNP-associated protein 2
VVFHFNRFTRNNFFTEKNPTIVNFPVRDMDLADIMFDGDAAAQLAALPADASLPDMKVAELNALLASLRAGVPALPADQQEAPALERSELERQVSAAADRKRQHLQRSKFDLLANVCHDSPAERSDTNVDPLDAGSYRVHVQNKAIGQWYEIQDLHVEETLPQLVGVSESYFLVYEKQEAGGSLKKAGVSAAELQSQLYGAH